jgi:hypothetical protein
MGESEKAPITGWSALPRYGSYGKGEASAELGTWMINSMTIKKRPICERNLNHTVVGLIAVTADYYAQAQQVALGER